LFVSGKIQTSNKHKKNFSNSKKSDCLSVRGNLISLYFVREQIAENIGKPALQKWKYGEVDQQYAVRMEVQ